MTPSSGNNCPQHYRLWRSQLAFRLLHAQLEGSSCLRQRRVCPLDNHTFHFFFTFFSTSTYFMFHLYLIHICFIHILQHLGSLFCSLFYQPTFFSINTSSAASFLPVVHFFPFSRVSAHFQSLYHQEFLYLLISVFHLRSFVFHLSCSARSRFRDLVS